MEIVLTVLITLGVLSLVGMVWGVVRLGRRVNDLEVAKMDKDDQIINLRSDLEDDIEHLHREYVRIEDEGIRNLDRRLDSVWAEIHKESKNN